MSTPEVPWVTRATELLHELAAERRRIQQLDDWDLDDHLERVDDATRAVTVLLTERPECPRDWEDGLHCGLLAGHTGPCVAVAGELPAWITGEPE